MFKESDNLIEFDIASLLPPLALTTVFSLCITSKDASLIPLSSDNSNTTSISLFTHEFFLISVNPSVNETFGAPRPTRSGRKAY